MVRLLAAGSCAIAIAIASCSSSTPTAAPSTSPSTSAADSPAATLRVHLDLLIGEHVFAVAKLADAAAAGRTDEYRSYAAMLAENGGDLAVLMHAALGETAGQKFSDAWALQNNYTVDYLVAAVTHNQASSATATSNLDSTYVPLMAGVLTSALALAQDEAARVTAAHVAAVRAVIDDAAAGAFAKFYADIAAADAEAAGFADALASQVVQDYPDRYAGDPGDPATDSRARLNVSMQARAYLMAMASDAAVDGLTDELTAIDNALAVASDMPPPADVWTQEASLVVAYAKSGDPAIRQNVLKRAASPLNLSDAMAALLQVVDDQRAKAYDKLTVDDRSAAAAFALAADELSLRAA